MVSKNKTYLYLTYFNLINTKKKNNLYHTIISSRQGFYDNLCSGHWKNIYVCSAG